MTTNIIVPSGNFFPAPVRTPIYADKDALKKGEMSRPWVHWFQSLSGGGKRVEQSLGGGVIYGPHTFADFTSPEFWMAVQHPWATMVPSTTNLIIRSNVLSETSVSVGPVTAMMFAPRIFPDVNGEIEITARVVPTVGTRLVTLGSFYCGFVMFGNYISNNFMCWGPGHYPSTYNKYIGKFYTANNDDASFASVVGQDYNPNTTVDIKWWLEPGSPTSTSTFNRWTAWVSLDGGAWASFYCGSSDPVLFSRRTHVQGMRFGVGLMGTRFNSNFTFTVSNFTVVKGLVYSK